MSQSNAKPTTTSLNQHELQQTQQAKKTKRAGCTCDCGTCPCNTSAMHKTHDDHHHEQGKQHDA